MHAGEGCKVRPAVKNQDGKVVLGAECTHHVVLTGVYADGQARVKLMNTVGLNSELGCCYCGINGHYAAGCMRFAGYSRPISIQKGYFLNPDLPQTYHLGDDQHPELEHRYTRDQQNQRQQGIKWLVSHNQHDPKRSGLHGPCLFTEYLPYMDFNRVCYTPFAHCFYRGTLRDIVLKFTSTEGELRKVARVGNSQVHDEFEGLADPHFPPEHALTAEVRKEMAFRAKHYVVTRDFSATVRELVKHGRRYIIEEWMRACDLHLRMLLCEVCVTMVVDTARSGSVQYCCPPASTMVAF